MRAALLLVLALAGVPAAAAAAAAADWRALRWGMTPSEAAALLGPAAGPLDPPLAFGAGLRAPLAVPAAEAGGLAMRALLQFDAGGLRQILFRPARPGEGERADVWALVVASLAAELGRPDLACARPGRPGVPARETLVWVRAEAVIHAVRTGPRRQDLATAPPAFEPGRVAAPEAAEPLRPAPLRPVPVPRRRPDDPRVPPRLRRDPPEPELPEPRFSDNPAPPRPRTAPPLRAAPPSLLLRGAAGALLVRRHDPAAAALAADPCRD